MVGGGSMPQMAMANQMAASMSGPMPGQMGNVMSAGPIGQQVPSPMQQGMPTNQMNVQNSLNHMQGPRKVSCTGKGRAIRIS